MHGEMAAACAAEDAGNGMTRTTAWLLILVPGMLLGACAREAGEAAGPAASPHAPEVIGGNIAWFEGGVEEAFAYARREQKPLFLYWSAEWCPPCHEIKATVFRSREFIERSRLFVAVYLDGDTDNAQALGEKFGVVGYPTVVVFSPEGTEITRIPGGIDIQAYANVLDLTLGDVQPVPAILARALDDGERLGAADCRLMAYYSWDQNKAILEGRQPATAFRNLAAACPTESRTEVSILYVRYLASALTAAPGQDPPAALAEADRRDALLRLHGMLDDYALARANLYPVLMSSAQLTAALTRPGSVERNRLRDKFLGVLDRMAKDPAIFTSERLYTAIGRIRFERIDDAKSEISPALRGDIEAMVAEADAATNDAYERQTVINAASNVLDEAGLREQAKALLRAELARSRQPYYFMVSLAEIEQHAGHHAEALQWFERAYAEARGPATRFQWGTYYVTGLIEMTPDDVGRIQTEAVRVVRELEGSRAFYQRPKAQLRKLEATLNAWGTNAPRRAGLEHIRKGVMTICATIPAQETAHATCESFLAPA
jgi:thioredoxin-related protein